MNNLNYYCFIPVLINFILSVIIYGDIATGRYAIFGILYYVMLFFFHAIYLMIGSILMYQVDYLQKKQVIKYWLIFNLPMLILVVVIDLGLYLYGDIEGKINNNDLNFFILNNTMLILWIVSSVLFRYNSNYFK